VIGPTTIGGGDMEPDMRDRLVATEANSGIGKMPAVGLARTGATVAMPLPGPGEEPTTLLTSTIARSPFPGRGRGASGHGLYAVDPDAAQRLWTISEEMVGRGGRTPRRSRHGSARLPWRARPALHWLPHRAPTP
jgi:hypothetical protein